jgi:hypothetical protein
METQILGVKCNKACKYCCISHSGLEAVADAKVGVVSTTTLLSTRMNQGASVTTFACVAGQVKVNVAQETDGEPRYFPVDTRLKPPEQTICLHPDKKHLRRESVLGDPSIIPFIPPRSN